VGRCRAARLIIPAKKLITSATCADTASISPEKAPRARRGQVSRPRPYPTA
jgi:hypothetical protein